MRRNGRSGCLGCLFSLTLLCAVTAALWVWAVPTALQNVVRAYGRHALGAVGLAADDDTGTDTSGLGYEGQRLPEAQQGAYLQLLAGIQGLEPSVAVFDAAAGDVNPAYKALLHDHPELFWLDGSCTYTYGIADVITVEPGLTLAPDTVEATAELISAQADAFFATLPADASDYDIAKAAYEYVVDNTDYVPGADQNQNIQSVFLGHASVCAGYARAFQYLLQAADIPCLYVEGSVDGTEEEHAWCIAQLDGVWTNVDPTWGDPAYTGVTDQVASDGVVYDYLCLTTAEVRRDRHTYNDLELWPTCDSTELDYYGRAGLLFDAYDEPALDAAFRSQAEKDSKACFKFDSAEAYRQAADALAAGTFCRDALLGVAQGRGTDSLRYSYVTNDYLYIIKLYW